jgi:hypothetical protein
MKKFCFDCAKKAEKFSKDRIIYPSKIKFFRRIKHKVQQRLGAKNSLLGILNLKLSQGRPLSSV